MQILVNQNNEITAYAIVGGIEREGYKTITIDDNQAPNSFRESFKPGFFVYENGEIKINTNYHEETETFEPPKIEIPGSDDALRHMFSTMQIQIVQANKMVSMLTQQNSNLSQQIVQMKQEIENLKGGNDDETTIS